MEWYLFFIKKYGYLTVLIGAMIEGDLSLAMGSILAQQGFMNFWLVSLCGLIGSLVSQAAFYFLGRWQGMALVKRFPMLRANYPKAHALVNRFGGVGILVVQYLYGMRLVTSFVLGTLKLKIGYYSFWLLLSLSLWSLGVAAAGYTLGSAIHYLLSRMQIFVTVVAAVLVILILAYRWFWRWTERQVKYIQVPEPVSENADTFYRRPSSRKWR